MQPRSRARYENSLRSSPGRARCRVTKHRGGIERIKCRDMMKKEEGEGGREALIKFDDVTSISRNFPRRRLIGRQRESTRQINLQRARGAGEEDADFTRTTSGETCSAAPGPSLSSTGRYDRERSFA